jgi:hypothetical protein
MTICDPIEQKSSVFAYQSIHSIKRNIKLPYSENLSPMQCMKKLKSYLNFLKKKFII